ncbi:MAG: class II aldolase/adducin family protein [Planctomycetota bacterium]|jgi:L-ribulose-5-phosphate 4-epimerase
MGKYDEYRREVLEVSQMLSEHGYFGTRSGSAGNVSVLIEGEEAVAVTPHGREYTDMTTDDICVIDFDLARIDGTCDPSVEAPLHVAVYKNRRDVNAVIHSHQIYASIFSILNEPIPPLFDEVTVAIGSAVEVVPYGVSGSPQLLENVVSKLDNRCHCYLLQNHGALCVGKNLKKTVNYVELLEKTASIYYRAIATGRPVTTLPDPIPNVLFEFVKREQDAEIARKDGRQQSE